MSDDLIQMFDKPGAMLDNAVSSLGKKAASTAWGKFKALLSKASEPLLRKNMGERYLDMGNVIGGCVIWFLGTFIALLIPSSRSVVGMVSEILSWHGLAHFFQLWFCPCLAGGALIFFTYIFGLESVSLMARYRAEGMAYHTMSRGIPRWGDNSSVVVLGITVALFLFNMPAGILFLASIAMSAKIASEQQAAIYSRYLDALDKKIEQEYLEDAILGKCPTEITQLHKPLPTNMDAELKGNVAAAAVGKPVKVIAKSPKPKVPVAS